ncbi:hypothetical protein HYFRA_00005722 [Hymenoscyphus fraxineus]|uniref:PH domain-containing protein n=1 Tax=Hymenoscyphus fraxineus TaxID=746836 RepID=A0A9N9KTV6_9HELO|nr:hypothetical protein HYFRA_00005722 [Hymenoscyphus fraxineus]
MSTHNVDRENLDFASLGDYLGVEMSRASRVSMEDDVQRHREQSHSACSLTTHSQSTRQTQEEPPSYEEFSPSTKRPKFNIQPREDEGQEVLPPYSCAISLENVFLRKTELEGAVHRAQDRNWYREIVTLQGTALSFHKYKGGNVFGKEGKNDTATGAKRGPLLRTYNLQHAEVGVAADYLNPSTLISSNFLLTIPARKRFVIRIRAEADQFLLSCNKIETLVLWLQSLFAAIDLAAPLDDRDLPRDLSIPRPRRRRARRNGGRDPNVVREQPEFGSSDVPDTTTATTSTSSLVSDLDDTESVEVQLVTPALLEIRPSRPPSPEPEQQRVRPSLLSSASRSRLFSTYGPQSHSPSSSYSSYSSGSNSSTTTQSTLDSHSSVTESGKWRPHHQWTPFYDLLYAKRCMTILTSRSPRKSNLVIMKGKRWVVDWATGRLKKWSPPPSEEGLPDYDEAVGNEEFVVGPYGDLLRI